MNEYLKFYEKYKISPVVQNIENFKEHVKRRGNLYRQLSVLPLTIKDKDILEIGPGGGYNALVTYTFEPSSYTLVEPYTTGYNELNKNFEKLFNNNNVYTHNCTLEDFNPNKKYDIIICEGLIPGLSNKDNFINKIANLLNDNGIMIITTADQISVFFEIVRKYIANNLIKDIPDIDNKVKILVDTLKGMTRSYEDWCLDNLIGDAIYEHTLNINQTIDLLKEGFYVLGTSPDIFTNYSWYKDVPTNTIKYNQVFQEQFLSQWHNLMDYRYIQKDRKAEKNTALSKFCLDFIKKVQQNDSKENIIDIVLKIKENLLTDVDDITICSIEEIINLFKGDITINNIENMHYFKSAFGRGQSYISFTKEMNI